MTSAAGDSPRYLIFNADDFGYSTGVNRGIVESHQKGVLTSTSMMVTGRAVEQAVALSRQNPALAIGLHFDVWGEDEREFDTRNIPATHDEFRRQLDAFVQLLGRMPTHIDSHRHAHREEHLFDHFRKWVEPLKLPLRGDGSVHFVGGFYAQWEWQVTELKYVSVEFLQQMLRNEVPRRAVTEFSCHPGYVDGQFIGVYSTEREAEVATLTDPRILATIEEQQITLVSYADWPVIQNEVTRGKRGL